VHVVNQNQLGFDVVMTSLGDNTPLTEGTFSVMVSDNMTDTMETEPAVNFEHYVAATLQIVEEFRDVLVDHTAELEQKAIATGGQAAVPQHQAQMHRLRVAQTISSIA
jgi:hypothetical protein